ncbi:unnamed protein product [Urochloa humidicola]
MTFSGARGMAEAQGEMAQPVVGVTVQPPRRGKSGGAARRSRPTSVGACRDDLIGVCGGRGIRDGARSARRHRREAGQPSRNIQCWCRRRSDSHKKKRWLSTTTVSSGRSSSTTHPMTCGSFQLPSRGAEVRRTTDAAVKPSSHKSRTSMKKQAKRGVRPNAQERQHCTRASIFMLPL